MNVIGYDEVLTAAEQIEFSAGLVGRVASLPGLAVLKLSAWADRGRGNPKDAHDLLQLMKSYGAAGNHGRLYDEEFPLLEAADHDPERASACLLGKDVARLVSDDTLLRLVQLIDGDRAALVRAMVGAIRYKENALDQVEELLRQLQKELTRGLRRPS